ncbi:MAG: YciI family protein, partial [Caldilineaceae bacterium]
MRYMLLIYGNEQAHEEYLKSLPGGMDAEMGAYFGFNDRLQAAGAYNAAEALLPVATASAVRVRGGETLTTHGPFAETHEQLGGFY